ncbi:efflux RND transporter periplasmic adaptor subunit [Xanthobacter aminoxidans]|uniref:efflux RND transporter periplasmic adaptor subunit n=1 Tax=Xanthobacter aminoxidans TaxID=186280 RepID=UPI002022E8DA|nr:efflux RND transporter periplasmic adaptor subunit [Xanthobacter aminoxidans]MCL8383812.1 efflux RND transporter periplasmic adaptor subunit [Xanthobacter aminoxidans]
MLVLAATAALTGCGEQAAAPAVPPRPVLTAVVQPMSREVLEVAGTIEPQVQTDLSFRVLGRLLVRSVNVGDVVAKDQVVAAIDDTALKLSVRSALAEVANAQAQLTNASGTEDRQRTLLETAATSRATFETAEQGRSAAEASLARARANLVKAREQLGYAQLKAEFAGVVTAVGAELGQVVSPGRSVVTIARPDIREAVVDIGEDFIGDIKIGSPFQVSLQLDGAPVVTGRVREIAPQADSVTRTRRVRITLDHPPAVYRLGSTVAARPADTLAADLLIPGSAVFTRDGKSFVWCVAADGRTVHAQQVTVSAASGDKARVTSGLAAGTRLVTAGVHSLSEGQKIRLEQDVQP